MVHLAGALQNTIKIDAGITTKETTAKNTKTQAEQSLWDDCGDKMVENLVQLTGCTKEEAKAKTENAISYAVSTMEKADGADKTGKKDGKITFDEWIESNPNRLNYMGVTEEEGREIFNSINIDGDEGLSLHELVALELFKDATSDEDKTKLDNNLNVKTENEQNGIKTIAQNMQALAKEEGKALFQDLYAMAFGSNEANIASLTKTLQNSLQERTGLDPSDLEYMTQEQASTAVEAFQKYLTEEMAQKDTNNDSFVTYDEWATGEMFDEMGLSRDNAPAMKTVFAAMDLNNDGKLDANEMASQYIFRDITSAIENYQPNDPVGTSQILDGYIKDETGISTNLTFSIATDRTDISSIDYARNNFMELAKGFGIYDTEEQYTKFEAGKYQFAI